MFWVIKIPTIGMGEAFADWPALPPERGGAGWGTLPVSLALIGAIAVFVARGRGRAKV